MNKDTKISVENKRMSLNKYEQIESFLNPKFDFRFNEVKSVQEYSEKGKGIYKPVDEMAVSDLSLFLGRDIGLTSFKNALGCILNSSEYNPSFDPLLNHFDSMPAWNRGRDHIADLCHFITPKTYLGEEGRREREWMFKMIKKHLLRTVSALYGKILVNKQCLVFLGKQNDGKTSLIEWLFSGELKPFYRVNPELETKDGIMNLGQYVCLNLDELSGLGRAELEKVKSMFSNADPVARQHYAKSDSKFKRRASFWASTNEREILIDHTGNVRFVVIELHEINHDRGGKNGYTVNVDLSGLWSQVVTLVKSGETGLLTREEEEENEKRNQQFQRSTPELDLVRRYFYQPDFDSDYYAVTATDVLEVFGIITNGRLRLSQNNIGRALTTCGYIKKSVRLGNSKSPTYRFLVGTNENAISEFLINNGYYITTNSEKQLVRSLNADFV